MLSGSVSWSTPRVRACHARAYIPQRFCFFAVTAVTHLSSKTNDTDRKSIARGEKHRGFAVARRNKKARDSNFLLNLITFTRIQLKNNILHEHVTDVTDKNIKLLAIRAYARA